jgi:transcriptional regulator with XRE-family HTH domain
MTGSEFIKATRLEKGLSFRRLGVASGISHQCIKFFEDNQRSISFDNLIKILHGLDVSLFEYLAAINYSKPVKNPSDILVGDAGFEPASPAVAA